MEVKSDPNKFETVHYTDIDVAYPGEVRSLTLEDGKDFYRVDGETIRVVFATGEEVVLLRTPMHWFSLRPRTMRRKVEEPKA